jgi:hypothetical protein
MSSFARKYIGCFKASDRCHASKLRIATVHTPILSSYLVHLTCSKDVPSMIGISTITEPFGIHFFQDGVFLSRLDVITNNGINSSKEKGRASAPATVLSKIWAHN